MAKISKKKLKNNGRPARVMKVAIEEMDTLPLKQEIGSSITILDNDPRIALPKEQKEFDGDINNQDAFPSLNEDLEEVFEPVAEDDVEDMESELSEDVLYPNVEQKIIMIKVDPRIKAKKNVRSFYGGIDDYAEFPSLLDSTPIQEYVSDDNELSLKDEEAKALRACLLGGIDSERELLSDQDADPKKRKEESRQLQRELDASAEYMAYHSADIEKVSMLKRSKEQNYNAPQFGGYTNNQAQFPSLYADVSMSGQGKQPTYAEVAMSGQGKQPTSAEVAMSGQGKQPTYAEVAKLELVQQISSAADDEISVSSVASGDNLSLIQDPVSTKYYAYPLLKALNDADNHSNQGHEDSVTLLDIATLWGNGSMHVVEVDTDVSVDDELSNALLSESEDDVHEVSSEALTENTTKLNELSNKESEEGPGEPVITVKSESFLGSFWELIKGVVVPVYNFAASILSFIWNSIVSLFSCGGKPKTTKVVEELPTEVIVESLKLGGNDDYKATSSFSDKAPGPFIEERVSADQDNSIFDSKTDAEDNQRSIISGIPVS